MGNVYIVMTSNCEPYEDYSESIDSVWSTEAAAIKRIEEDLSMKLVPETNWTRHNQRQRWVIEHPVYPEPKDFEDDPLGWADCFDDKGKLIPYWVNRTDAWIISCPLDSVKSRA